jgi:hypothetical protein
MQWIATKFMPCLQIGKQNRNIKFLANNSVTGVLHPLPSSDLLYDNGTEGRRFGGIIMIQEQLQAAFAKLKTWDFLKCYQ